MMTLDTRDRFAAMKAQQDQLLDAACGAAYLQGVYLGLAIGMFGATLCVLLTIWIIGGFS